MSIVSIRQERAHNIAQRVLAEGPMIEREQGEFFCKCGSPELTVAIGPQGVIISCNKCGNAVVVAEAVKNVDSV